MLQNMLQNMVRIILSSIRPLSDFFLYICINLYLKYHTVQYKNVRRTKKNSRENELITPYALIRRLVLILDIKFWNNRNDSSYINYEQNVTP